MSWKLEKDQKKVGQELRFEQATSERGMQILRVTAKSDHDPLTFVRAYCNKELRKTYDKNFKDGRLINRIGCNLYQAY